jgi:hypothetical protein
MLPAGAARDLADGQRGRVASIAGAGRAAPLVVRALIGGSFHPGRARSNITSNLEYHFKNVLKKC